MFTYQYTYTQGSAGLKNQTFVGDFLITEEGQFLTEEDNVNNYLTIEE